MDWGERIDRMTAGYRDAALVIFGVKTGIFEALGAGSRTPAEVAGAAGLDLRATEVVMAALCAAGVLAQDGDRFAIPAGARPYLLAGGAEDRTSIIGHNRSLLRSWARLDEVLRTGQPAPRPERAEEEMRDFILGMENVSRRSSTEVASRLDLAGCRRLLDLGGGPGTAAITFARANPDLACVVFDLPGPVGIADEQIAAAGLAGRVTTVAGDFLADPLGEGFDVVYIANILHMLGPEECRALLAKAAGALAGGGRLVVKDFFLDASRTAPAFAAQFSVNMLVTTAAGRTYTRAEMEEMFRSAGCGVTAAWPVATHSLVIEAGRES
jgi:SAM-dependent methyltransferase